jgi:hypothetical protein
MERKSNGHETAGPHKNFSRSRFPTILIGRHWNANERLSSCRLFAKTRDDGSTRAIGNGIPQTVRIPVTAVSINSLFRGRQALKAVPVGRNSTASTSIYPEMMMEVGLRRR